MKENRRFIGFLAKNRKTEHYEHWEVAVKFYLLHQGCWYGPNAEDRLDIKLDHMLNHQLPLSQHPLFIEQHPLWAGASQHLLMQGRLYTNPFSDEQSRPIVLATRSILARFKAIGVSSVSST